MPTPLHRRLSLLALLASGGASIATSAPDVPSEPSSSALWRAAGFADVEEPQLATEERWRAVVSVSFEQPTPDALEGSATFEASATADGESAYTLVVSDADAVELGSVSAVQGAPPQALKLSAFGECSGVLACRVEYVIEVRATAGTPEPTVSITTEATSEAVTNGGAPTLMVIEVEPLPEDTGDTGEDAVEDTGEDTGDTAEP